jgi:hypothetical protein
MPQYRKKPVVIEARQYWGDAAATVEWINTAGGSAQYWSFQPAGTWPVRDAVPAHITIDTLEGKMRAVEGDWIIRGVQGEFYPCKPDIFDQTYEPVE